MQAFHNLTSAFNNLKEIITLHLSSTEEGRRGEGSEGLPGYSGICAWVSVKGEKAWPLGSIPIIVSFNKPSPSFLKQTAIEFEL